ncbi:MAG TPA: cytochrome c oxidase assembly protein [Acidimicrobiales bacterium]|nr:cytochrome c oxidase assembly protein [Acidimicrobiales bacterium]
MALTVGIGHEIGLRRLAHRQTPEHRRATRHRSWAFYAGLTMLIVVASGPLERWAMARLSIHMVLHVLEMFYLPPLLIIGAPWVPLLFAIPVDQRQALLRWYYRSSWTPGLRGMWGALSNPIVAIILFNGVMVAWHLPVVFDWAADHGWVMNWLMGPSFVVVGLLFWRIILPSHPWGPRGSTRIQIGAIVVTAFEMLILAMAMSIFTKAPWYSMNVTMDGPVAALRDQRYAAGILWICGDFWAIPALVYVGYRIYGQDGGVSASLERVLGRV